MIGKGFDVKFFLTAFAIVPALFVAACASPTGELRKNLRDYGMSKSEAKCVARELGDNLRKNEIKSINRILDAERGDGTTRPSQLLAAVETLDDPRILRSVTIANAGCLLFN